MTYVYVVTRVYRAHSAPKPRWLGKTKRLLQPVAMVVDGFGTGVKARHFRPWPQELAEDAPLILFAHDTEVLSASEGGADGEAFHWTGLGRHLGQL